MAAKNYILEHSIEILKNNTHMLLHLYDLNIITTAVMKKIIPHLFKFHLKWIRYYAESLQHIRKIA